MIEFLKIKSIFFSILNLNRQNNAAEKERIQYFTKRINSGTPIHKETKHIQLDHFVENQERVKKAKEEAFKEKVLNQFNYKFSSKL